MGFLKLDGKTWEHFPNFLLKQGKAKQVPKRKAKSHFFKKFLRCFCVIRLIFPCSSFPGAQNSKSRRDSHPGGQKGWGIRGTITPKQGYLQPKQQLGAWTRQKSWNIDVTQGNPSKSNNPDFTPVFPEQQGKIALLSTPGWQKFKGMSSQSFPEVGNGKNQRGLQGEINKNERNGTNTNPPPGSSRKNFPWLVWEFPDVTLGWSHPQGALFQLFQWSSGGSGVIPHQEQELKPREREREEPSKPNPAGILILWILSILRSLCQVMFGIKVTLSRRRHTNPHIRPSSSQRKITF